LQWFGVLAFGDKGSLHYECQGVKDKEEGLDTDNTIASHFEERVVESYHLPGLIDCIQV